MHFFINTQLPLPEEGLLDLGDSIGKFVGPYTNVPGHVTIPQLLSHRSGINGYLNESSVAWEGWDGTIKSKEAQSGVYVYLLTYTFEDGVKKHMYGDVTLLR